MHRGLRLVARKEATAKVPLTAIPAPSQIRLSIYADGQMETLIATGDKILLGQLLARSGPRLLHSSVSGIATGIETTNGSLMVTIDNDGLDSHHPDLQPIADFHRLSPQQLQCRIADAGIVGLGGAAFPTATKLKVAAAQHTKLLIVNCVECEPFITCDDALMRDGPADIVIGTQALLHASEATEAIIAIEADKPEAIRAVSQAVEAADDKRLRVQWVDTFYPAGGERQLIQSLTGREVPSGGVPADVDTLCQNVSTAFAIARLISTGEPLISRIVTITGSGIKAPGNVRVRFGTSIESAIAHCDGYASEPCRLLMGGTMMGVALPDDSIAVSAATNCILAATIDDIAPRKQEMPCIRCGDCADVCPAGLLPQQLLRYSRSQDSVALHELGLRDCIECGCCDYVCPSQIPLTSTFSIAKAKVQT